MHASLDGTQPAIDKAGLDTRSPETKRLDYMATLVIDMQLAVDKLIHAMPQGNTQRVIYKSEGPGVWVVIGTIVSAVISVMCVVVLIVAAILIVPDFHDIKAWQDILRRDVARLQAAQQQAEKSK